MKQKIKLRELKFKKLRFRRIRFRVLMVALGIVATLLIGFNFWFLEHAENTLERIVENQSGGKIKLKVEEFKFNWITNKIRLNNAVLYTTADSATNTSYLFNSPSISIKAIGFLPLLFNRILIDSIYISKPNVIVTKLHAHTKQAPGQATTSHGEFSVAREIGRISESVNKAISVLHISRFILDDGSFSLIDKTSPGEIPFLVSKINIRLDNLQVDSTSTRSINRQINFTDEIALQTSGQDIAFPGNKHFLSFKNFKVTLRDRRVEFDSCTIRAIKGDSSKTAFNIFFDKLKLTNIDFDELYRSEIIKADSVFCKNPDIFFDIDSDGKNKKTAHTNKSEKIDELLQQLIGDILLNYVVVQNADLHINTYVGGKANLFASKNNNIEIRGLSIKQNEEKPISMKKFTMSLYNYKTLLQNGRYAFAFDSLLFNDNAVYLSKFSFEEFKKGNRVKSLAMPQFELRGFSWESLLYNNIFAAESARFFNPEIRITTSKQKNKQPNNIFETLSDIGEVMSLNSLEIVNGNIHVLMDKSAKLELQNTSLHVWADEFTASKKIKNLQHSVKNLFAGKVIFSKDATNVALRNLKLTDNNNIIGASSLYLNSNGIKANANDIRIHSIILDSSSSNILLNGLRWSQATLNITKAGNNKTTQTSQPATGLILTDIRGSNTTVAAANNDKKISAFFNDIFVNKIVGKTGRPEIFGLKAGGKDFLLTDPVQTLSIDKLSISDNNNSILSGITYQKLDETDSIVAEIPELIIIPNITQIVNGNLFINSLLVQDPVISARLGRKENKSAKQKNTPQITLGSARLERPRISLSFVNADNLPSHIEWNGKKENSYIEVKDFKATTQIRAAAKEIKIYLTNFEFITTKNKRIATNDNKLNLLFKDFLLEKNDSNKMDWQTTANILSIDKLMFDSLGKKNAILRMDNGDIRNISLNGKFPKLADIIKNSENLLITGTNGSYATEQNNFYWHNLRFDKGFFTTDSFSMQPTQSLEEYKTAKKYNADYLSLSSGLIFGGPFDMARYGTDSILSIRKIDVNDLSLFTFKDKTQPDTVKKYKPLPTSILKNIPSKFDIGIINLKNMNILYEELNHKTNKTGKVPVTNLNGSIEHVKNHSLQSHDSLYVNASANVLDQLPTTLRIRQSYTDTLDAFLMDLKAGPVALEAFNQLLIPLAGVKVTQGFLDSLHLTATANNDYSKGQMQMYYHNLKVQLLHKKNIPNQTLLNKVVSWLANLLVVRTSNKGKKSPVFFERDQEKGPINFYIKTALSGLKSGIGIPGTKRKERKFFRKTDRKKK